MVPKRVKITPRRSGEGNKRSNNKIGELEGAEKERQRTRKIL